MSHFNRVSHSLHLTLPLCVSLCPCVSLWLCVSHSSTPVCLTLPLCVSLYSVADYFLIDPRQQDEYHMMHLVCASRSPPPSPTPRSPSLAAAHTSARVSRKKLHQCDQYNLFSNTIEHLGYSANEIFFQSVPQNSEDAGSTSAGSAANQDSPPAAPPSSVPGSNDGLRHRGGLPQYSGHTTPPAGVMPW